MTTSHSGLLFLGHPVDIARTSICT